MRVSLLFISRNREWAREDGGGLKVRWKFLCTAFDIILHSMTKCFPWGKFNFWHEKYISFSFCLQKHLCVSAYGAGAEMAWMSGRGETRRMEMRIFNGQKWKIICSLNQWNSSLLSFRRTLALSRLAPAPGGSWKGNFIVVYLFD